ncbi:DUF1835 domain-containing protein [Pontimicrobium sp. MEBiC01747]
MKANSPLHITNGSSLTDYLKDLKIEGDIITWNEMLCEGPTINAIDSEAFIKIRTDFFKTTYNAEYSDGGFVSELAKFNHLANYTEIVLWFEYDLFCHINLIAAISLLKQKDVTAQLYLVCSGRVENEPELKGLSELTPKQLKAHYNNKTALTVDDIALAQKAWNTYCGNDHNLLKPLIVKPSNFTYLSNSLKAHIRRFPDTRSGLNTLEYNTLKLVKKHNIKSRHHLLGYTLHYQGYYGFGDTQLEKMIDRLAIFFNETETALTLNRKGHLALELQQNFLNELQTDFYFGGVNKADFLYNKKENKLIKHV